jgi:hypothetical protein
MYVPFPDRNFGEGYVVEFLPESDKAWVGNFRRGLSNFSCVVNHPDEIDFVVISGGAVYVVNPYSKTLLDEFGGGITAVFSVSDLKLTAFQGQTFFYAYGPKGRLWMSDRVTLDGMRNVRQTGKKIIGEGWNLPDMWHRFEIDLISGRVQEGAIEVRSDSP